MLGPVVHLSWHLDVGGGELFLRDLARELRRRGVEQHVATVGPAGALAIDLAASGIPVRSFGKTSKLGLMTVARMAAWLMRLRPSIVQTHGEAGLFWGVPAAAIARVPSVSLVYQNYPESWPKMVASRWLLRWPQRVVTGSHDVERFVRHAFHVPANRVQTIYCGIAPESFARVHRQEPARPTIVTVGRLVTRKGHEILIDALSLVRERIADAELVIVGDGPCRAALEHAAHAAGIAHAVRFAGTIHPTHAALGQASVFAFPSLVEPQGLAVLEAFAAGVPVVASRTGGIPEMIVDGVEGLLVEPGDSRALAAALVRMLSDPPFARACTERARLRLQTFHVAHLTDAYMQIYDDVIAGHARAAMGRAAAPIASRQEQE